MQTTTQLRVTYAGQLVDQQLEVAVYAPKVEWQALLDARGKAKAAPPSLGALWVCWPEGRLYTTDGVHVLRVQLSVFDGPAGHQGLDTSLLELAIKQAATKEVVGLVRTPTGHLAVVGTAVGDALDARVVVGSTMAEVQRLDLAAPELPAALSLTRPAAAGTIGEVTAGYALRPTDVALLAKVCKAVKPDSVGATTAARPDLPHRWDLSTDTAEWSLVTMGARCF